jgi:hypothetical protein
MLDGVDDEVPIPLQGRGGVLERTAVILDGLEDEILVSLEGGGA